jgi:NTE family protein
VSGGSIVAGVLGLAWTRLRFDPVTDAAGNLEELLVEPIRAFARRTVDVPSLIRGVLLPGNAADRLEDALGDLYGDATLQDLPTDGAGPRFVINATNLASGALWRFSRPYARDWRVGEIRAPRFRIATAVAASAAFPPFFAPLTLEVDPSLFTPGSGALDDAYRRRVPLADGGVYDNLGLETVFKRYRTVYVSDGGGKLGDDPTPDTDWARQTVRIMKVIDNQVRSLRKRIIWDAYDRGDREGAYWGIRSAITDYRDVLDPLPCPPESIRRLAEMATRLEAVPESRQEALIDWGYAIADAAIRDGRRDLDDRPAAFPFPRGVEG